MMKNKIQKWKSLDSNYLATYKMAGGMDLDVVMNIIQKYLVNEICRYPNT